MARTSLTATSTNTCRQSLRSGQPLHCGETGVQTVAPNSIIAWFDEMFDLGELPEIGRVPGLQPTSAIRDCVGAISVGIVHGQPVLDLNYVEDSGAEVDMNVVMTGAGEFVEVQGTAEQVPFGRARLDALLAIAEAGIRRLISLQRRALETRAERVFTL